MPRIIYLGLQAFANTPQLLLPSAQNPLVCDALPESSLQLPETQVLMLPELDSLGARHLGHWLKQSTENHLLIAWPQPQPWLAACLATGRGVEEVLASWHQQAECLLALFRSARRQVGLVGYAPGATLKTLEAPEVAESVAPVYQLAAAQLIGQHSDVLETCNYLFASSIEHQALPHNAQALASSALEEYEQLLQTDIQCKANQQQISVLQAEKEQLTEQANSAASDQNALLEQLMAVQEALEENTLKNHEQAKQLAYAESLMQWLRAWGYRHASEAYRHSKTFKRALPQQVAILNASDYFDAQWYCEQYPDVESSGITPAAHYLKFGAMEGRNPSAKFDTCFYLSEYTDVAESGQNPLLHYLRHGQFEERLPIKQQQQLPAPL
ncbi:hypothetical protein LL947_03440 [Halomonas sp. BLK-85]